MLLCPASRSASIARFRRVAMLWGRGRCGSSRRPRRQVSDRVDGLAGALSGFEVGAMAQDPYGLDPVGKVEAEIGDREDPGDAGLPAPVPGLAFAAAHGDVLPGQ